MVSVITSYPASLHLLLALLLTIVQGLSHDDEIPDYLAKYGIPTEQHWVTTSDGYILSMFRMRRPSAPVVMLQHGILSSAWCWLDNSPEIAPGFQLYYMGYDVWLTNNRGNMFSLNHTSLKPFLNKQFWNFSFTEMGHYDVPANIDYILGQTGKETLAYVGHSEGTTQFFSAMTSIETKVFLEQKVSLFVCLSPVSYMSHQSTLLLRVVTDLRLGLLLESIFPFGFLTWSGLREAASTLCHLTEGIICQLGSGIVTGYSQEDDSEAIANVSAHFPAGTSVKAMEHYEQLILSNRFQEYDYGAEGNLKSYGTREPPQFDFGQAQVPTAFFIGTSDDLGDPVDEERAAAELPKSTLVFKGSFPDYSHITWMAGTWSSFQAWFPRLQELLRKYHPLESPQLIV
mmetsp:Transcript_540/g.1223  ORF Transcript_540/g.1223 Transcript_540/m.1223 type:complete len:400 (+) Transcript_540:44-1243(+)